MIKKRYVVYMSIIVLISMPLVSSVQWDIFEGDKMFYVFGDNSSAVPILNFMNENFTTYLFSNGSGLYYIQKGVFYNLTNASGAGSGFDGFFASLDFTGTNGFDDFVDDVDMNWDNLTNIPAGFVDGIDNTSSEWQNDSENIFYNGGGVEILSDHIAYLNVSSYGASGVHPYSIINLNSDAVNVDGRAARLSLNDTMYLLYYDSKIDASDIFSMNYNLGKDIICYMPAHSDGEGVTLLDNNGYSLRFNDTGLQYPYKANNWGYGELDFWDIRYSPWDIAVFHNYRDSSYITINHQGDTYNNLHITGYGGEGTVLGFDLDSNPDGGESVFSYDVFIGHDLNVTGKITASGGVDPPYVSYDKMSFDDIIKMSKDVKPDNVMQFWSSEYNCMMIYDIEQDKFFDFMGVEYF